MEKNNMSYRQFRNKVLDCLATYKKEVLKIEEKGIFRYRGEEHTKEHILPILSGKSIQNIVKEYNVLNCLKGEDFLIQKGLHRYAHHLNSSQLMCYNFFRPYIIIKERDKTCPNSALLDLLSKYIAINQCDDAECHFEYEQEGDKYKKEGTNFDFYLKSGETEVFFEIKYTEAGFGKCDDRHKDKFARIYNELIENCPAIKESISFNDEFRKNYQLFRNSIRATDKNKYVIFIYDENNQYCKNQLDEFLKKYITDDYNMNCNKKNEYG